MVGEVVTFDPPIPRPEKIACFAFPRVTEVRLKPDSRYQISGNNAESGRIPDTRYLESGIKLTSLFMMGA